MTRALAARRAASMPADVGSRAARGGQTASPADQLSAAASSAHLPEGTRARSSACDLRPRSEEPAARRAPVEPHVTLGSSSLLSFRQPRLPPSPRASWGILGLDITGDALRWHQEPRRPPPRRAWKWAVSNRSASVPPVISSVITWSRSGVSWYPHLTQWCLPPSFEIATPP